MSRVPYHEHRTVNPYNGCIKSTNLVVRNVLSLIQTLKRKCVKFHTLKHAKIQPLQCSNTCNKTIDQGLPVGSMPTERRFHYVGPTRFLAKYGRMPGFLQIGLTPRLAQLFPVRELLCLCMVVQ